MAERQTCRHCGSVYEVTKIKLIMRDKDSLDCPVCGNELLFWDGAVMYRIEAIVQRGQAGARNPPVQ